MSYRYTVGENTEQEIKRIIDERFDRSVEEFKQAGSEPEHANHQMRKNMKKERAALRLVRDSIGKKNYKKWNVAARDTARMGEELRESEVAVETIGKLREKFNWKSDDSFYQAARAKLRRDHQNYTTQLLEEKSYVKKMIARLEEVKSETDDLAFEKDSFKAYKKGLKRVYKRGRKAYKNARKNSTFENHHEWRKRVKYLWYQIRILRNTWPGGLKCYAKELHQLSDYLGDDHDLYDLKNRLHKLYNDSEYSDDLNRFEKSIDSFSSELREDAHRLGEKIYAEKPKVFIKRIGKYWKAAHK